LSAKITITCHEIGNCSTRTKTLSDGFTNITHVLIFLIGALAIIFIIVSGLQIVLSNGDSKRYQQGRDGLQYSIVGLIVAVLAYAAVSFIAKAF
jgi:uncharacterized protein HemY